MRQRDRFKTNICFLKKLYVRLKQMVSILVLIYCDGPQLGHRIKANCVYFQTVDPEISLILFFLEKGLRLVSPPHFVYDF